MEPTPSTNLVFSLFCTLSILGLGLCLIVGSFYIRFRHLRLVKMTSPRLNLISIAGAGLLFMSCGLHNLSFFVLELPTAAVSAYKISVWFGSCGFTIFFGAILLKTWRVYRIFESSGTKRPVIRDPHLISGIFLLLLTDVLLLSLWQGFDEIVVTHHAFPSNSSVQMRPGALLGPRYPFTCSHLTVWLTLMFLWKSLLICVGSYLSWAVRLVNVPALSDGPVLMLCSYVALLSTAVAVVLLALTAKSTDAFVTVVQTWLVAGTAISLLVSHAAKILSLISAADPSKMAFARSSQAASFECLEEELYALTLENTQLKKQLIQREEFIRELQQHRKISARSLEAETADSSHDVTAAPTTEAAVLLEASSTHRRSAASSIHSMAPIADDEITDLYVTPMNSSPTPLPTVEVEQPSPGPEPDQDTSSAPRGSFDAGGSFVLSGSNIIDGGTTLDGEEGPPIQLDLDELEDWPHHELDPLVMAATTGRIPTITKVVTTTTRTIPKEGTGPGGVRTLTRKTLTTTTTTRCRRQVPGELSEVAAAAAAAAAASGNGGQLVTTTTNAAPTSLLLRSASRRQAQAAVSRSRVLRYELAQTIAESYNLEKDGDTISYVSHCISPSLMGEAMRRLHTPSDDEEEIGEGEEAETEATGEEAVEAAGDGTLLLPPSDLLCLPAGAIGISDAPGGSLSPSSATGEMPLSEQASPRLAPVKSWKKRFSQRFLADSFLSPTVHRGYGMGGGGGSIARSRSGSHSGTKALGYSECADEVQPVNSDIV